MRGVGWDVGEVSRLLLSLGWARRGARQLLGSGCADGCGVPGARTATAPSSLLPPLVPAVGSPAFFEH